MTYSDVGTPASSPVSSLEQSGTPPCPKPDTKFTSPLGLLGLSLSLVMAASMWLYVGRIFVPQRPAQAIIQQQEARGNLSDLYSRWIGTRERLLHNRDPYSNEVTQEIQRDYASRTPDAVALSNPIDQSRFSSPGYVILLFAPTVTLPFLAVEVLFFVFSLSLTAFTVWTWTSILRTGPRTKWIVLILTLGSWTVVQALLRQQLSLVVAVLIAASVSALIRNRLGLAGMLLALATIEPLLIAPLVAWYLVWVFGDFRRRHRLLWSFLGMMALLVGASEVLLPGWGAKWWALTRESLFSAPSSTLPESLLGRLAGWLVWAIVVACLVAICWRSRRAPADSSAFVFVVAVVLSAGLLINPQWSPYDQLLLLPAILLLARDWMQHRLLHPVAKLIRFTGALLLGWQWFWAVILVVLSFRSPLHASQLSLVPVFTILILPLIVFTALVTRPSEAGDSQDQAAISRA